LRKQLGSSAPNPLQFKHWLPAELIPSASFTKFTSITTPV